MAEKRRWRARFVTTVDMRKKERPPNRIRTLLGTREVLVRASEEEAERGEEDDCSFWSEEEGGAGAVDIPK